MPNPIPAGSQDETGSAEPVNPKVAAILDGRHVGLDRPRLTKPAFLLGKALESRTGIDLGRSEVSFLSALRDTFTSQLGSGATLTVVHDVLNSIAVPAAISEAAVLYVDARSWLDAKKAPLVRGSRLAEDGERPADKTEEALSSLTSDLYVAFSGQRDGKPDPVGVYTALVLADWGTRSAAVMTAYTGCDKEVALLRLGESLRSVTELSYLPDVHQALGGTLEMTDLSAEASIQSSFLR